MRPRYYFLPLLFFTLFSKGQAYVVKDVTVIPMTPGNPVLQHANVLIDNHKIAGINGPVPANVTTIDGKGKYLVPGLIDMHTHNLADINFGKTYPTKGASITIDTQDFMWLYVVNGVTTVFELNGRVEHFGERNEIVKGDVTGPRMAIAALIDGGSDAELTAHTPDEGRQAVRLVKGLGYEFIKVYSGLNIETYQAIVAEADKQGMKVVGHIPNAFRGRLAEAFVPGFGLVAHAEELAKQTVDYSEADAQRFAALCKANGTWLTPTLVTMVRIVEQTRTLDSIRRLPYLAYVHPLMQSKWLGSNKYNQENDWFRGRVEKMVVFHQLLVKAFKEAGVPIVAGTDAGISGVVWGYSLHDELRLLVQAGLTNEEALAAATRLPAEWLQIGDKVGTVEVGKYADLVLLDSNPLEDIGHTREIAGVFVNGKWVSKDSMKKALDKIAAKNKANMGRYDWKKRKEL